MKSLPDIYRNAAERDSQDEVLIPDYHPPRPAQEEAPEQPTANEDEIFAVDENADPDEIRVVAEEDTAPLIYTESDFQAALSAQQEQLRAQLRQQAYRDALAQESSRIREALDRVNQLLDRVDKEHEAFMNSYRDNLAETALTIAEKVVLHQIAEDNTCLQQLVTQTVNAVKNEEWVSVKVSDELSGLVQSLSKELKRSDYANVTLNPEPCPPGTCMVETPNGVIDASVAEQIKNLRADLQNIH